MVQDNVATTTPAHMTDSAHKNIVWYAPHKFEAYGEEEIKAVEECLRDGWLAPGPRTNKFEDCVAKYFGKQYGIFVNSGSSANTLSLLMAGLNAGDEVITPACTFSTTVAPLMQLSLKPVFCDVETRKFVPSVQQVLSVLTPNTKALFIPNLAGSKPDWKGLRSELERLGREDVVLIEDSCDTMTYTEESDLSVISFYASHVITAGGGGGMVMCNSAEQRATGLQYRDWGRIGTNVEDPSARFGHDIDGIPYDFKFLYGVVGYNFKSTEMNAAFGLVQMEKLPQFLEIRRRNVNRYLERLSRETPLIMPEDDGSINWLAFPALVPESWKRQDLLQYIESRGIQTRVFFAGNVTRHPAYRMYFDELNPNKFANADTIMRNCFMLGAHHGLSMEDIDYVCDVIRDFSTSKTRVAVLPTSNELVDNADACDL